MMIGLDPSDESNKLREVLALCPASDHQRLLDLFRAQLEPKAEHREPDWSDDTKDGPRNAPVPVLAKSASA